jgi:uncharacterized protein (TIGR02679 family)
VTGFATLSTATLGPLWSAVHERLSSGRPVRQVRVGPLNDEHRNALADLLGMDRLPGEFVSVSVPALDQILRESVGAGVRDVVSELVGPLGDRAADRRRAEAERARLWEWLAGHEVVAAQPVLADWAASVRRSGLIGGSVSRTRHEIEGALRVLARLPASGTPLPVFAEETLADPHALDDGTRCAALVMRALTAIYEVAAPVDMPARRALWERAGVTDDELSPVVLAAGLRPAGGGVGNRVLRACAEAGQAAALTLSQVRATALPGGMPDEVWVFENPSVLALAIGRFGVRCPPIVCTSGWPNSAAVLLLQGLASAGCRLRYHGDFDGEGIRIAANVAARTGAVPWRMSCADYLDALAGVSLGNPVGRAGNPVGRVTEAPWDGELATHLRRRNLTVSEERVASGLLDEIAGECGV